MTITSPAQLDKNKKYFINSTGNTIDATNINNPKDGLHFPEDEQPFRSITIIKNNKNHLSLNINLSFSNFRKYKTFYEKITDHSLQNIHIHITPPPQVGKIYYHLAIDDKWVDRFNLLFAIIHEFDRFDKQTIEAIYRHLNLSSPLLESYERRRQALARGAAIGFFGHQESFHLPTLPPEIACLISKYLVNEASRIASTCKASAIFGKKELEHEDHEIKLIEDALIVRCGLKF